MSNMKFMGSTELTKEQIKDIKKLHESRERADKGLFLIEGVRLMEEALKERVPIEQAIYTARLGESSRGSHLLAALREMNIKAAQVPEKAMDSIAGTENPQGIMAAARQFRWSLKDVIKGKGPVIIACGLQDPGNLGTIIRTADAGGCGGVVTIQNTVDIYNSKVIRATMGSIFRLPVLEFDESKEGIYALKKEGYQIIATTADSRTSYLDINYGRPTAILIGREAAGIPEELLEAADIKVFIPMKEGVESLNAAISTGILIYEAFRQRLTRRP